MTTSGALKHFRSALAREPAHIRKLGQPIVKNLQIIASARSDDGAKAAAQVALAGNLARFEKARQV